MIIVNKRLFSHLMLVALVAVTPTHALHDDIVAIEVRDVGVEGLQFPEESQKKEIVDEQAWYKKRSTQIAIAAVISTIVIYIIVMHENKKSVPMVLLGMCGGVPNVAKTVLPVTTPSPHNIKGEPHATNGSKPVDGLILDGSGDSSGDKKNDNALQVQNIGNTKNLGQQSFQNTNDKPDATNGSKPASELTSNNSTVKSDDNSSAAPNDNVLLPHNTGNANSLEQQPPVVPAKNQEQSNSETGMELFSKFTSLVGGVFNNGAAGVRMR